MKSALAILFLAFTGGAMAQSMTVFTVEGDTIQVSLVDEPTKRKLLEDFQGVQDNTTWKQWTARTYKLANGKLLVEFYDRQAALIENESDFKRLETIRFVKNHIWNLKKDISYKIELPFEKGFALSQSKRAKKLEKYKSSMPDDFDFEVFELDNQQVLLLDLSKRSRSATIYRNIKPLASENKDIEEQAYGQADDEYYMKELAKGNRMVDYEPNEHLIYPQYLEKILESHQLALREQRVFVSNFFGDLYESKLGYWVLIDDVNQSNGAGDQLLIMEVRIYDSIAQVRAAEAAYDSLKKGYFGNGSFFQKISDLYGSSFPSVVDSLIKALPLILNIDSEQLSLDEKGIEIIDEAIHWNHPRWNSFNDWLPAVYAYYGSYYIRQKRVGKWEVVFDEKKQVWIPQVRLPNGKAAFDPLGFFKALYEWPTPLKWAGDFEGRW